MSDRYRPDPPGARRSAVVIALFENGSSVDGSDVVFPLIERQTDGSVHSGQISLPGGAWEEGDTFPEGTAVREADEEIGMDGLEPIGRLTPLYVPPSNFTIHPIVAVARTTKGFDPNPDEVARVIVAPVGDLSKLIVERDFVGNGGVLRTAPCFLVDDVVVWGATAMILSEFLELHADTVPKIRYRRYGNEDTVTKIR